MAEVSAFRSASWGVTKDEVLRTEHANFLFNQDDRLGYQDSLLEPTTIRITRGCTCFRDV
jgi:hypothetical protein